MESTEKPVQLSLLLVDDAKELCPRLKEFFAEAGHRLDCEHDGRRGLVAAAGGTYDLAVLDVMLPVFDGFTVLQHLRRRSVLPVIILTARVQHRDRILGLNAGADDYLLEPFVPEELLARIHAVLRRTKTTGWKKISDGTIGHIRINSGPREVGSPISPAEIP